MQAQAGTEAKIGSKTGSIRGANFPVLAANIDASADSELAGLVQPYAVLEVGGEKIGVVGYTTEDTAILSSPGPNVKFLGIEQSVQAAVETSTGCGFRRRLRLLYRRRRETPACHGRHPPTVRYSLSLVTSPAYRRGLALKMVGVSGRSFSCPR